jgi:hypothetical protein
MFEELNGLPTAACESFCWTVVRGRDEGLTVDDVVRRLGGDPHTMTMVRPASVQYDYEAVFVESRGESVVVAGYSDRSAEEPALRALSRTATVHGVYWLINNMNRLYHAVDGVIVTQLDVLRPHDRWGADPDALTGHLDALYDLHERSSGPFPDWETALATIESLTGVRLDAEWFHRPQLQATIPGSA